MNKAKLTEKDVKVAKNPTEALWVRAKENLEREITELENSLLVSKAFLKTAKQMAEEAKHY